MSRLTWWLMKAVTGGRVCQTLDVTDPYTGWTEMVAVRNKAQRRVFEAPPDLLIRTEQGL
ncbi:MAG: hypothetical protein ABIK44_02325 [candidate division WOR-3 bacterium]